MREVDAAALLSFTRMPDLPLARRWMCARLRAAAPPPPVLAAMEVIPRHCFAPVRWRVGYAELSFWTGTAWMLSPATVARVAGALPELSGARVLEIGTGSGYQTALLSMLGAEVVSLDASQGCLSEARGRLKALGTPAVVEQSDGDAGYDGETRYDAIVVNVPLPAPPLNLLPRLEAGRGVVVAPVATSDGWQRLMRIELRNDQERVLDLGPCQFAPVTTTQRKELP